MSAPTDLRPIGLAYPCLEGIGPLLFRRHGGGVQRLKHVAYSRSSLQNILGAALMRGARSVPSSLPLLPVLAPPRACCCCCWQEPRRKGGGIVVAVAPSSSAPCTCQGLQRSSGSAPCPIQRASTSVIYELSTIPPTPMSPLSASSSATALSSPRGPPAGRTWTRLRGAISTKSRPCQVRPLLALRIRAE